MSRFDRIQTLLQKPLDTLDGQRRKLMDELRTRPELEAVRTRLDTWAAKVPAEVRAPLEEERLTLDAVRRAASAAGEALGAALRGTDAPATAAEDPAEPPMADAPDAASVEAEMGPPAEEPAAEQPAEEPVPASEEPAAEAPAAAQPAEPARKPRRRRKTATKTATKADAAKAAPDEGDAPDATEQGAAPAAERPRRSRRRRKPAAD